VLESLGYAEVGEGPEAVDRAVGQDGFLAEAVQEAVPLAAVVDDLAKRRRKLEKKRAKYDTKPRVDLEMYKREHADSSEQIATVAIPHAEKSAKELGVTTAETLKRFFGWSDDEVAKYLDNKGAGAHVTYLTAAEREDYKLELGSTIKQKGQPFTTKGMWSKFAKDDHAIFVMSKGGEWYAGRHKVGFFHHTSFLGAEEMDAQGLPTGGEVAGAGEIKVIDGTLKAITNKSGHYIPGRQQMLQTLYELKEAGVSLNGVGIRVITSGFSEEQFEGDAAAYYDQHSWRL
jgi:hypothetical protein